MAELSYKYGTFSNPEVLKCQEDILELHNTVFPYNKQPDLKGITGDFINPFWFLVFWGTRLIGMCTIGIEDQEKKKGFLYNVSVAKFQRRKKLASAMNYKLRTILPGWTLRGIVKDDNIPAIFAFGKLGGMPQEKCTVEGHTEYIVKFKNNTA